MTKQGKIVVKEAKTRNGKRQYMVVVVAANGKVLMTSETLSSKRRCRENIVAAHNAFITKKWVNAI